MPPSRHAQYRDIWAVYSQRNFEIHDRRAEKTLAAENSSRRLPSSKPPDVRAYRATALSRSPRRPPRWFDWRLRGREAILSLGDFPHKCMRIEIMCVEWWYYYYISLFIMPRQRHVRSSSMQEFGESSLTIGQYEATFLRRVLRRVSRRRYGIGIKWQSALFIFENTFYMSFSQTFK